MCSIIGCRWGDVAAPLIVRGLKRMEYRGYDSVGVATEMNGIHIQKGIGRVDDHPSLGEMLGNVGIGHTRWATHGAVESKNAHPHLSQQGNVAIVHNGMIDNYAEIKKTLNCEFVSDTDSEVIANLLGMHYARTQDALTAMKHTVKALEGHYSFIALFDDGVMAAARNHEPLIVGVAPMGFFFASDVLGFVEYTDDAIYPENHEFVVIDPPGRGGLQFYDFQGKKVYHDVVKISKEMADANKEEYAHYTLKEIHDQISTMSKCGKEEEIESAVKTLRLAKKIYITGSGTSYNAALIGKTLLRNYCSIEAETIISSEARYDQYLYGPETVLIAISQSGESADVLDTVKIAREKQAKIIAIVNNKESSLGRIADHSVGLYCGPEVGVAATKSFTSQTIVLLKLAQRVSNWPSSLRQQPDFPNRVKKCLSADSQRNIREIASHLKNIPDVYVLGRGYSYPIALEGALKLKEIAYIHAEGLPAGELKHGPLALLDHESFVVLIHPYDMTYADVTNSAQQIKSRGAKIIGISEVNNDLYDHWIALEQTEEPFVNSLISVVPLQLLAYYLAVEKNADPDRPRNLAKSCTVR